MKIFKPDNLGLLHRSFALAGKNRLSAGLMAFFQLDANTKLTTLLPEANMWVAAAESMGSDTILDEGFPKPSGEFLVFGAAHAPAHSQVTEVVVSAQVGSLKKSLFVRGDRHFNALGLVSAAKSFECMPITPATAFGGDGSADNPLGKGLNKVLDAAGVKHLPLPNVEAASGLILAAGDVAKPAGFWAYAPDAPERSRHLGKFDQPWLKNTWPHLPDSTDLAYFQTAPTDQRLSGFFRGDEAIALGNMHPSRLGITANLPRLRGRCFVNRRVQGGEEFTEIQTQAETVWLFPELECGIVLYRAVANTSDEDADDVLHLMAEWESMDEQPQSFNHYHDQFRSLLPQKPVPATSATAVAPASGIAVSAVALPAVALPAVPATAAAAAMSPEAVAIEAEKFLAQSPELQEVHRLAGELDKHSQALMKEHGITAADLAPFLKQEPELHPGTIEEVERLAADLNKHSRELMQKHNISDEDLQPYLPKPQVEPVDVVGDLEKALVDLNAQTRSVMQKTGITQADVDAYMLKTPELAHLVGVPMPDIKSAMASLAAVVPVIALPKVALPAIKASPDPVPEPPASKLSREEVIARHALRQGFASLDLSGLDLSALDLSGADFSSALLEKTSFKDSLLAGSVFKNALLAGGDFSGADMRRALLTGASAGGAQFTKTRLNDVNASKGDFTGADFSQAQIANANISHALFDGSKMAGLIAANCNAEQASFADCDLTGSDMAHARLTAAVFNNSKLGKASFTSAACDNAEFYGADATQADFSNANLKASRADATSQFAGAQLMQTDLGRANWDGVMMAGARFDGAVLDDADFTRVKAADASFAGASAKGSKFDKSDLSRANFTGVNLFKGSLRKANTEATRLQKANLYGVDFYDTAPTIASLEGSNIDQTLLLIRKPGI